MDRSPLFSAGGGRSSGSRKPTHRRSSGRRGDYYDMVEGYPAESNAAVLELSDVLIEFEKSLK